jgi:transposase
MPELLSPPGTGPVSAARLRTTWSHPGRLRNEAALAALTATAPIPASSGRTTRHRINPYGDRSASRALPTIAISRLRHHQPTIASPPAAPPKARPPAKSAAAPSPTSPATSTA